MTENNFIIRIKYLISRTVVRPERVVSVVCSYHPYFDVIIVALLSLIILILFSGVSLLRDILYGTPDLSFIFSAGLNTINAFVSSLFVLLCYAGAISITAVLLGGKAKFIDTILTFILFISVSFSIAAPFVAIIKLVDVAENTSKVSESLISIGPWLYTLILIFIAVQKIHKTTASRAIAYLGIAALPLILVYAILRWELNVCLSLGIV